MNDWLLKISAMRLLGLVAVASVIGPQPALYAQNKKGNTFLKKIGKGISNLNNKPSSSSSSSSRKKKNTEFIKNVAGIGLFASEAYQQISGNQISSGQHTAIDLAQGLAVNSLDMKQFKSLSLTQQTTVARKSRSQLSTFNSSRQSRYKHLRKSNSKTEIELEQKQMAEVRAEAENRLKLINEHVENASAGESTELLAELIDEAIGLEKNVSHLLELEGLFAGLQSKQNTISRDYVGSFLTEI